MGLDVLFGSGVLGCHTDIWQEKFGSELRAASVLMEVGYSIDCLMVRWGPPGSKHRLPIAYQQHACVAHIAGQVGPTG